MRSNDAQPLRLAAPARNHPPPAAADGLLADLERDFEAFGLSRNEASVLLAVLRLGSATVTQIARMCPISPANIYKLVGALETKRLVERLPGGQPATWLSVGRDETLERLCVSHRERLRQLEGRAERVKETLAELVPDSPSVPLPFMHFIPDATEATRVFENLLSKTQRELLIFTVPPFGSPPGHHDPFVFDSLERGVSIKTLYPHSVLTAPDAAPYRRLYAEKYVPAGVEARVVETLSMKLAVFDRKVTLLGLIDPSLAATYPRVLLVDHPGFAHHQALGFESLWANAVPFVTALAGLGAGGEAPAVAGT